MGSAQLIGAVARKMQKTLRANPEKEIKPALSLVERGITEQRDQGGPGAMDPGQTPLSALVLEGYRR